MHIITYAMRNVVTYIVDIGANTLFNVTAVV